MTASHCSICASDTGPSEGMNGWAADSVCDRISCRSRFVAAGVEDPGCWLLWVDILELKGVEELCLRFMVELRGIVKAAGEREENLARILAGQGFISALSRHLALGLSSSPA